MLYVPANKSAITEISAADQRRASIALMVEAHDRAKTMATAPAVAAHTNELARSVPFDQP
jgi:hypothetical protein